MRVLCRANRAGVGTLSALEKTVKTNAALLLIGVSLALASPATADQIQVGYSGASFGPYQSGVGGEFTLNDKNNEGWLDLSAYVTGKTSNFGPAGITSFQTFCIEKTEFINGYSTTYNAQLNTNAMYGNVGAPGDPVSVGSGWLYRKFARGSLNAYAYSGTTDDRKTSAGLLQKAFWWLEGEEAFNAGNIYMAAVVNQFGSQLAAQADGGAIFGVFALNLWTGTGPAANRAQDQLYYNGVADGGTTFLLLSVTLLAVAILARQFRGVWAPAP
jgi:hypothetical protein